MQSFIPLNMPRPIQVAVGEDGLPTSVVRAGRRVAVATITDTWRVDDEWWRDEISRLYYQLMLADETTITVFEDLIRGGWYAQRYHPPVASSEG
jgi:hypothetical protein